jgi:hypothetical protein
MSTKEQHSLDTVVESVSQLITATKQWMLSKETRSTQQLVLTAERIKALDRLERQIRKELKSAKGSSERVWQLVNVVIATVTRYALDRLSDSIQYIFRREQWVSMSSLLTAVSFIGQRYDRKNHQVFKNCKRSKTVRASGAG